MTKERITEDINDIINSENSGLSAEQRLKEIQDIINTKESIRLLTEPSIQPACGTASAYGISTCESMGETCRNGKLWKDCTCC